MLQLSRFHHTVDLKPVQPVCELSKLCGAFQGVSLVHHSLHALSIAPASGCVTANKSGVFA